MEIKSINASMISKMFLGAAANLDNNKETINELNVFPVPDGDTGTNMTMTIMSAAKAVEDLGEYPAMRDLCKAISSGSLRGARGNSGVILSQLFRGFTKVVRDYDDLNVSILAEASQRATETAYKAVMKPKEGTILTVARGISDKALSLAQDTDDIVTFLDGLIQEGDSVLAKTPDMLPVLKQAGVVDSGGQGLMEVLKGAYIILTGGEIKSAQAEEKPQVQYTYHLLFQVISDRLVSTETAEEFKKFLEGLGDVDFHANANSMKVALDCDDPGAALTEALKYGYLDHIHTKNVKAPRTAGGSQETVPSTAKDVPGTSTESPADDRPDTTAKEERKEMAFVAVSVGDGLNEIFKELGCDDIIEGGQTMNPSTEDILNAIEKIPADNIFVLPNNKNIIMAAKQAAELAEDRHVIVIPTKTIPQGITALVNFVPEQSPAENEAHMAEEITMVRTGQITYAIRDTEIDHKQIRQGDYMGIGDDGILAVNQDMNQVCLDMLDAMVSDESGMITIYYGKDVTDADAEALAKKVQEKFSGVEVEVENGGQPVYYYTVSVE